MSRTPRLSKSDIEYLTHVWNFVSGCTNGCPHCWARKRTERFKNLYPNGFNLTYYPEAMLSPMSLKKPAIIGCVFMGDLFLLEPDMMVPVSLYGELPEKQFIDLCKASINPMPGFPLKDAIYSTINCCPQHTFLFLTKQPQNLIKWSPFPENCWVGVTVTDASSMSSAGLALLDIQAKVKYLSIEPFLAPFYPSYQSLKSVCDWLIIGAQTKPYKPPEIEWVQEIVEAADRAGIPVFLKDNLLQAIPFSQDTAFLFRDIPGVPTCRGLRQEMPQ